LPFISDKPAELQFETGRLLLPVRFADFVKLEALGGLLTLPFVAEAEFQRLLLPLDRFLEVARFGVAAASVSILSASFHCESWHALVASSTALLPFLTALSGQVASVQAR
jgi:hypothetical protein